MSCIVGLAPLLVSAVAMAQPKADRGAMEEKKRLADEKRKRIADLKKQRAKETSSQAEERIKMEKKAADAAKARNLFQLAVRAANFRRNVKAFDLMQKAWRLDSQNMDYSFNAAQLAEAAKNPAGEFTVYAGFMNVAVREEQGLGPGESAFKTTLLERMAKARQRMSVLRKTLSVGRVTLKVTPESCEVYFDDHMVGEGGGTIESITGQHKVRTDCLGFYPVEQFVNVRVGDANKAVLKPRPVAFFGYLVVKVKPRDGVTIFLDDVPLQTRLAAKATEGGKISGSGTGKDPYRLQARKWIIRFKKEGYDRWHRRIKIERDRIYKLSAAMERMADTVETSGSD
ncbi:MAG: hypothetical protein KC502_14580 [Myxococcales bacterium]|nr:hypothetical protein [Myxococcales bacterium]